MSKISANECAGRHVRFNAIMPTYMSGQPEDMNAVLNLGRVVEDTVERNSWGKSRSDRMCCFPNTRGLHRASGDAPFETQNFTHDKDTESSHIATTAFYANSVINWQTGAISEVMGGMGQSLHPSWCHVNKSYTPSSRRTQVAACAYKDKSHKSASRIIKHKRCTNANQKRYKQVKYLKDVQVCNVASNRKDQFMTSDSIRRNIVVCDGGDTTDDAIQPNSSCSGVYCLHIHDGDLWVADRINASLGLRFIWPGETLPIFIGLPRNESLGIMNDGRSICSAIRSCASTQQQLLARGTQNHVFMENGNKYCCVGAHPGRAKRGVLSGLYRLKNGIPSNKWDSIHKLLKCTEYAFDRFMDTDIIRHISCARLRVNFKTMEPSTSSSYQKTARYYNGLGFGINLYLKSHIDQDFTMSIVQAHTNNRDYQVNNKILCYFEFPRIDLAVALWPGDFLLINPQEPHSISSRCRSEDEIFCISSYLKNGCSRSE
jgi:hypothetical protein